MQASPVKTLTAAAAQAAFIQLHPLKYSVAARFDDNHVTAAPNLSKQTSIASAVERFKAQPNILVSSWILVDGPTLKNKAAGATKVACTHAGHQQMALAIKVMRRTVTISAFTRKEIQGSNPKDYIQATIAAGERFLSCKSEEKQVTLCVKGPWNPITGDVQIFHYEEGAMPAAAMVDKYLKWYVDASGRAIRPQATS